MKKWIPLFLILGIGLFLRITTIEQTQIDRPFIADAQEYYLYAYHLRQAGIYSKSQTEPVEPDAMRPPFYPLLIALLWHEDQQVLAQRLRWLQALLDTGTVALIFLLARLSLSYGLALGVALLTALSPHLISMTTYALTESVFTFLMIAALYLLALRKTQFLFLAGTVLALAALTRPTLQYFIVFIPLWLIWQSSGALKKIAWLFLGFALVYSPWLIRNLMVLGQATDPSLMINTLHHGIYPDFTYEGQPESKGFPYRYDPRSEEISQSLETVLAEIKRRFTEEPKKYWHWYLIGKPIALFSWNLIAGGHIFIYQVQASPYFNPHSWHRWSYQLMYYLHWPLVILALGGMVAAWFKSEPIMQLLSLLLIYYLAVHLIGAPFPRYSIPLRPVLYLLALWTAYLIAQWLLKTDE